MTPVPFCTIISEYVCVNVRVRLTKRYYLYYKKMEVLELANIKSAKKRILVSQKRADRNKAIRSKVKTAIKKVDAAVEAKDKAAASEALVKAVSEIDKATRKGIYHKNTAARKVSRLTIAVNKLA